MWTKVNCIKCKGQFQLYIDTKKVDINNWVCKNCIGDKNELGKRKVF